MTSIEELYRNECDLIPARDVNAYVEPKLNPLNAAELIIDSSWGEEKVDLTPAFDAAETTTHLFLSPENAPVYLQYDNEDGAHECIHGDALSRIISITKLKDVSSNITLSDGDILIYSGSTNKFTAYHLTPKINSIDGDITELYRLIDSLTNTVQNQALMISNLDTRVKALEEAESEE